MSGEKEDNKLKDKLPIIGAAFLFIVTLVNFIGKNDTVTGFISMGLFVVTLILFGISKRKKLS